MHFNEKQHKEKKIRVRMSGQKSSSLNVKIKKISEVYGILMKLSNVKLITMSSFVIIN
jgi:hypothetical protein